MSKRKCILCGQYIEDNSDSVPYKSRYAHTVCFQNSMKLLTKDKKEKLNEASKKKKKASKPKAELKDPVSEEDYQEKKQYYEYIRSYYRNNENEKLPAKVYVLTEKYIEQYGYTYESMYQTLRYMREIQGRELQGDGIGLIPYVSDEAQEYYKSLEKIEEVNKDKDVSKMYKEKVVVIQPKHKQIKQINVEEI